MIGRAIRSPPTNKILKSSIHISSLPRTSLSSTLMFIRPLIYQSCKLAFSRGCPIKILNIFLDVFILVTSPAPRRRPHFSVLITPSHMQTSYAIWVLSPDILPIFHLLCLLINYRNVMNTQFIQCNWYSHELSIKITRYTARRVLILWKDCFNVALNFVTVFVHS
jgi:hypothetical protein